MIISLSMILHYIHYCQPNLKNRQDTSSCVVVNVVYLPKVCIRYYYHGGIVIFKNSRITAKVLKTEGLGEKQIAYTKLIKIQSCHMGIMFIQKHMTWQRQHCVQNHSHIMRYQNGNVHCDVVPSFLALIFLTRKQMISIPTPVLQLVCTFII